MEKTSFIDPNNYFVESKKAIQIVLENEQTLSKQMGIEEKHQLVSSYLKTASNPDEYDALEKLEKELKRKIQFRQFNEPAVPNEYREKVSRNVAIEQSEVNQKLAELVGQLNHHYKHLEKEVLPLIKNIETLERLSLMPVKIDVLLNGEIGENTVFKIEYLLKQLNYSRFGDIANSTLDNLRKAIDGMQKLESTTTITESNRGEK
ncbi:hypothetical protein [Cytobacillus sp. FSL H8-0458]|uniref:hypothetical protein n=1 Tax=Cytobacillus sp. FSL H8-0458 TaxID=2975346 RepID=UPI0030F900D2